MTQWRPSCGVDALRTRAEMLATTRRFFAQRRVLEVQTPVLGASTVTDPAIDSMRLGGTGRYLQTSPEYHMKRLIAAGAPSIYQLGPVFRAGEQGRWHNPEFVMLEWYRLGFDDHRLMDEVADLVDALLGSADYRRLTYASLIKDRFDLDVDAAGEDAWSAAASGLGLGHPASIEETLDLLLAEALSCQPGRVFVTDFPPRLAALARLGANGAASRFELVVDGMEIANGYHELCDADELERRMADDGKRRRTAGSAEVGADQRLLAAQRHGLPDCAGVAVGFDRLVALRLGAASIAETMAFGWDGA